MINTWIQRMPWDVIQSVSETERVPAKILAAIVQTESSGNRFAVRFEPGYKYLYGTKENAIDNRVTEATETVMQMTSWGYCQIMGAVARELGLKGPIFQLLEPEVNLRYCAALLKRLARKYSQRNDIIAAYNAGSAIRSMDGRYKNQAYVDRVNGYLADLEETQKEKDKEV